MALTHIEIAALNAQVESVKQLTRIADALERIIELDKVQAMFSVEIKGDL